MRVVLDTNVLVSAALKRQSTPGATAHIVDLCHDLLKSLATERQLFEVVARPHLAAALPADTGLGCVP
jgi:predicted nucleic acid-binding protein